MHPNRGVLAALVAALCLGAAAAQAELTISFFDKAVYTPGSDVYVKVTVRNDSPSTWRFKLADEKRLSVGFEVRSLANRRLEAS
ncbi:MAG TPA: hypothetical protein PLI66_07835, partial [Spirochaetales bacterium]|nr:hypothetical protein [Spirochaetales bacterium]